MVGRAGVNHPGGNVRLKAYYKDGTTAEADVGAASQVALEDEFDILFTDAFDDGDDGDDGDEDKGKKPRPARPARGRMKYLYFLTWAALHADGQDVGDDWRAWLKNVKDAGFALDEKGKPKARAAGNRSGRGRSAAASST
jgi:hypothetical protein